MSKKSRTEKSSFPIRYTGDLATPIYEPLGGVGGLGGSKAEAEIDQDKRRALFKQVVTKVVQDLPIFPIGFTPRFFTFRDHVKNFVTNGGGDFEPWGAGLSRAWVDK